MANRNLSSLGLGKKLLYASIPTLCLLLAVEVAARRTGAAERCPGYKSSFLWVCDPILYFKPNPGQVIHGKRLNAAGFRSREFTAKRPGVYRIVALGDSCTFGVISPAPGTPLLYVEEPYPQQLQHRLDRRRGEGKAEVFNAGVPGYNSYQGLMLLRTKLRRLGPDLITVRFGWNDHFMSPERHIRNAFHEPRTALGRAAESLLLRTALYPLSRRLGMELKVWLNRGRVPPDPVFPAAWRPNVPLEEYEHNLRRIVEVGRGRGAAVWLLTSAHALLMNEHRDQVERFAQTEGALALLRSNGLASLQRLTQIHESYNEATRRVGRELGVVVIDMEAVYRAHAGEHLFALGDVAHPTQEGHALEAATLDAELAREGH